MTNRAGWENSFHENRVPYEYLVCMYFKDKSQIKTIKFSHDLQAFRACDFGLMSLVAKFPDSDY